MRGPYGTRRQERSITASLPKAPPLRCSFLLAPSHLFLSLSFSSKPLVANQVVKVSGEVEPTAFPSLAHLGIYVLPRQRKAAVPGSEGRQTFRRRPLFHFTFSTTSNTESHQVTENASCYHAQI